MEMEDEEHLPFLDTDVYRTDGTLGHKIYRKPTHTNLYLCPMSHHHPSNKPAVLETPALLDTAICEEHSLDHELEFLKNTFKENGYSFKQIQRVLSKKEKIPKDKKPTSTAFLPYVQLVSGRLNRMLKETSEELIYYRRFSTV